MWQAASGKISLLRKGISDPKKNVYVNEMTENSKLWLAQTSDISTDQINELEMLKQFARFLIYIALQAAHLA